MPRTARIALGGMVFHVLNRANARAHMFAKNEDDAAFKRVMTENVGEEADADSRLPDDARRIGIWSRVRSALTDWPVDRPRQWPWQVNRAQPKAVLTQVRISVQRGRPVGSPIWQAFDRQATRTGIYLSTLWETKETELIGLIPFCRPTAMGANQVVSDTYCAWLLPSESTC